MPKFSWKTALAGAAVVALAGYAFAAQPAPGGGPMQPNGQMHTQMRGGVDPHAGMNGHAFGQQLGANIMPTMPG
jgi:hypothetical protein